jgi:uncharacterized phage-like protein YoqJ
MAKLEEVIRIVMKKYGDCHFICGGALGIDQMAFNICNQIQSEQYTHEQIPLFLELAMPFENQSANWPPSSQYELWQERELANKVTMVDTLVEYATYGVGAPGAYHPAKMQRRNEYMVDKSDLVIAVWNGSTGGTGNCVRYARKLGKQIIIINPDTLRITVESGVA